MIDFAWYFFIAHTKLGFNTDEIGFLTIEFLYHQYKIYKDNFDLEMTLTASRKTYQEMEEEEAVKDLLGTPI